MRTKTRMNRLLVVFAVILVGGVWTFTTLVDTAWAKKPSEPPGGGDSGGGGSTAPTHVLVDLGLGNVDAWLGIADDINEQGLVIITGLFDNNVVGETGPYILTPLDTDGDEIPDTWFRDDNADGLNDLLVNLAFPDPYGHEAMAINDLGQVVGWSASYSPSNWTAVLVSPVTNDAGNPVWSVDADQDGVNDLIIDLDGNEGVSAKYNQSAAFSINNKGQIVGSVWDHQWSNVGFVIDPLDADGDGTPDTWFRDDDGDGTNDLIIELWGLTFANDINDQGQIAGTLGGAGGACTIIPEDTDADGVADCWFRDDDGDTVNDLLVSLGPGSAYAINSGGEIVGMSEGIAARWVVDEVGVVSTTVLGNIKGMNSTRATGINDLGHVVGFAEKSKPGVSYTSFLWKDGVLTEVDKLLVDATGLNDQGAHAINNAGLIVGVGWSTWMVAPLP